jgi:putative membrane protein
MSLKRAPVIITIAVWSATLAAAAPQQTSGTKKQQTQPKTTQTQPKMTAAAKVPTADATFIKNAGEGGQAEVELATLAQQKAKDERVKAFAQRLQQDHTQANSDLQSLASGKDVTIPSVSAAHKATKARLEKLDGAAFDKAYIAEMVKDHQSDIAAFTKESSSKDADVKAFVDKTLPTLKAHLQQAQDLQKEIK